jgi:hypothetical protein
MFEDITISKKLNILNAIIGLGIMIIGISTYLSFSNIHEQYNETQKISKENDYLKSIIIGGLLYYSASGVVFMNPEN